MGRGGAGRERGQHYGATTAERQLAGQRYHPFKARQRSRHASQISGGACMAQSSGLCTAPQYCFVLPSQVGGLYYLCALVFVVGRCVYRRPLGDESHLSWHRMQDKKGFAQGFKEFVKR